LQNGGIVLNKAVFQSKADHPPMHVFSYAHASLFAPATLTLSQWPRNTNLNYRYSKDVAYLRTNNELSRSRLPKFRARTWQGTQTHRQTWPSAFLQPHCSCRAFVAASVKQEYYSLHVWSTL